MPDSGNFYYLYLTKFYVSSSQFKWYCNGTALFEGRGNITRMWNNRGRGDEEVELCNCIYTGNQGHSAKCNTYSSRVEYFPSWVETDL